MNGYSRTPAEKFLAGVKARLNSARLGVDMREDRELVRSTFRDVDRLVAMVELARRALVMIGECEGVVACETSREALVELDKASGIEDENGNEYAQVMAIKDECAKRDAEIERLRQLCKRVEELDDKNASLQAENEKLRARVAELESYLHTCGPDCRKAGCVNTRLREDNEALRGMLALNNPQNTELLLETIRLREALDGLYHATLNDMTVRGLPHEWNDNSAMAKARAALKGA